MSIFKPHKTKPRQFNYIPRYYDPQKEAIEQRRRELHGTSSETDDLPYQPGDYLRTQREARRESRESNSKDAANKMLRMGLLIIVLGMALMYVFPRITSLLERILQDPNTEGNVAEVASGANYSEVDALAEDENSEGGRMPITIYEHGEIDYTQYESLTPEVLNEIEEWNQNHTLTIYSDDVEIIDGKRVEE